MTILRFSLLAAALVVGVSSIAFETWATSRHRAQQLALQQHATRLERQIAAARARLDATRSQLASAERDLAALPAADSDAGRDRDAEVATWLARVRTLKQLLAQDPAQRIPELQLLDDDDWLNAARNAKTDTEEHRRLSPWPNSAAARKAVSPPCSSACCGNMPGNHPAGSHRSRWLLRPISIYRSIRQFLRATRSSRRACP